METRYIDATPTWSAILPALLQALQSGGPRAETAAREELQRMARLADLWVSHVQELPRDSSADD
jgi:hypothetical protein